MPNDADRAPFETVLETANAAQLAVAKSVLDDAGIPYLVQGDEALGLFPLGAFGRGPFRHGVAAMIRVQAERAADARELLTTLPDEDQDDEDQAPGDDG